jgi:hypothetical protein
MVASVLAVFNIIGTVHLTFCRQSLGNCPYSLLLALLPGVPVVMLIFLKFLFFTCFATLMFFMFGPNFGTSSVSGSNS